MLPRVAVNRAYDDNFSQPSDFVHHAIKRKSYLALVWMEDELVDVSNSDGVQHTTRSHFTQIF